MKRTVLILAPHTDDGEFGCGGTIVKLLDQGWEAHYVAFSDCRDTLPRGCPADTLVGELKEAPEILAIPPEHLTVLGYRARRFHERRQDILDDMIRMKDELAPGLVLLPSINDTHQDHQQIAQEGFRAFKTTCMLGYEMPWNNLQFRTTAFTVLEERHIEKKIEAMDCYKSQAHRFYSSEDFIRSLARTRGIQIGVPYAETFELFRWIM